MLELPSLAGSGFWLQLSLVPRPPVRTPRVRDARAPTCTPGVSRRCRRLTPICDHGSGSPSPLVSIETRARTRRGPPRHAPRAWKPRSAEHRLYRCGRRRSRQPARERPYTLWKRIGVLEMGSMPRPYGGLYNFDARALRRHDHQQPRRLEEPWSGRRVVFCSSHSFFASCNAWTCSSKTLVVACPVSSISSTALTGATAMQGGEG